MELIWDGIREAFRLIFTGNAEVYEITLLSLTVSGAATGIALVIGLSVASCLAFRAPPGRTAPPPAVAGLTVPFPLRSRKGTPGLLVHSTPSPALPPHRSKATPVVTAL